MFIKNAAKRLVIFWFCGLLSLSVPVGFITYQHLKLEADPIGELIESLPMQEVSALDVAKEREKLWLARAIYFEARGEGVGGQLLVAHSILNRVADPRWPDTIEAVVRQDERKRHQCQYSFMCDGKPERIVEGVAWRQALAVATVTLEDYEVRGPLTCAHSYHASYVTNKAALRWFATLEESGKVGTHKFYC